MAVSILQATGSLAGALVFVGANAALAIFCYLFIVGEIKRVEFAPESPARNAAALAPHSAAANNLG